VGKIELRNSLSAWAKEPKVKNAWKTLAQREGLDEQVFEQASWGFADGVTGLGHQVVLGMSKARSYGWFGTVDSREDFIEVFKTAQELKFLPKV